MYPLELKLYLNDNCFFFIYRNWKVMKSFYLLAASQRISFQSLIKNCNHKCLGIYYLLSAFIFGISGTLISVLIRIELYSTGNRIISPENQNFYNISITLHGFLMIFTEDQIANPFYKSVGSVSDEPIESEKKWKKNGFQRPRIWW